MGLNPNYTEEHDWEVVSANVDDDQSSLGESDEEEDLIVDDDDQAELHRQLLPSSPGPDTEQNDLLQPNLIQFDEDAADGEEQDGVNNQNSSAVQVETATVDDVAADSSDVNAAPFNQEETTPLISESHDLTDTVVVSNADLPKDEPKTPSDSNSFSQDSNQEDGEAPPPQSDEEPRGPQKFVANLGASVKHLGDAIGKEGQKIGQVVQKEGQKIGSSIQKESHKLGKVIGDETKRIGEATQRVFKPRSPSPSAPHARHRPEHTSRSPPRDRTATAEEEPSSLIATVLTGAAVLAGGILLARGNKGAGAALLATGGATYMVNEAAKESRRFDTNLNEELGMHMN